jgi:hypothetical protein
MNRKFTTNEVILSGLLLATGIILPMIFHMFSLTGPIALPMHIPVLMGGFLLPPQLALLLGITTPFVSSVMTGMPVFFPMAIIMSVELGTYGLTASLASKKFKLSPVLSLISSMAQGKATTWVKRRAKSRLLSLMPTSLPYDVAMLIIVWTPSM